MILISHRGNVFGENISDENSQAYIQSALSLGLDCEVDIHLIDSCLYLGHDTPEHKLDLEWLEERKSRLWIHCKNLKALSYFNRKDFNYFWHQNDKATLTSRGFIWAYPGMQPIENSIAVMPELNREDFSGCIGVCSDFVGRYLEKV
jgi:hypothetical protein